MPELPEVETIKRDLLKKVLNKEIIEVKINLSRSLENPQNLSICGKIKDIKRLGKYLILHTPNSILLIHLRMTGKLIYHPISSGFDEKHVRVIFYFKEGDCLLFNDVRTFGKIEVLPAQTSIKELKKLGIDALSNEFDLKTFSDICKAKRKPIKTLLLDQNLIAGIGNIYAMEILFAAKVSPLRISATLNNDELSRIHKHSFEILNLAIKHNGTSISDFRRVDDKTGEFQNFLKVYGKKKCPVCDAELTKIKQGGRSTTFCEHCQT